MTTKRMLGGRLVNPVGLGCMNLSWAYVAPPPADYAERLLHRALDLGYDHLDTARLYGRGANELLIGTALSARRREFFLASKMGIFDVDDRRIIDCRPEIIRREVEISLKALRTDHIDLYYMHRLDRSVPIEESVGAMGDLVREGKIGGYGLSEVSAATLRRAHGAHPVMAVQNEYSLWSRNSEIAVLQACAELGVAFVAFSPLGRGALANGVGDATALGESDIRRMMPRFQGEHWAANQRLIAQFAEMAAAEGVTPAQLSLAWVLARGAHVHVIPGSQNIDHVAENIARGDWRPSAAVMAALDALINRATVSGERYPPSLQATIDTEEFS